MEVRTDAGDELNPSTADVEGKARLPARLKILKDDEESRQRARDAGQVRGRSTGKPERSAARKPKEAANIPATVGEGMEQPRTSRCSPGPIDKTADHIVRMMA